MTFRVVNFPIQLGRAGDPMILAARVAVADVLRSEARAAISRAGDAGIDAMALGQRLVMSYMTACRASRFLRGFPPAAARWCFMVEQHTGQLSGEGYPSAAQGTVGTYGYDWLTVMPHRAVLVNAGGIRAAGVLPEGTEIALHEVREVRISRLVDLDNVVTYQCTVIMATDTGPRLEAGVSDPNELAPIEPEDQ